MFTIIEIQNEPNNASTVSTFEGAKVKEEPTTTEENNYTDEETLSSVSLITRTVEIHYLRAFRHG